MRRDPSIWLEVNKLKPDRWKRGRERERDLNEIGFPIVECWKNLQSSPNFPSTSNFEHDRFFSAVELGNSHISLDSLLLSAELSSLLTSKLNVNDRRSIERERKGENPGSQSIDSDFLRLECFLHETRRQIGRNSYFVLIDRLETQRI